MSDDGANDPVEDESGDAQREKPFGERFLAHYLGGGGSLVWSYAKVQTIKKSDRHELAQLLKKWLSRKELSALVSERPEYVAQLALARQSGMAPGDQALSTVLALLFGWLPYDQRRTIGLSLWCLVWSALIIYLLVNGEIAFALSTVVVLLAPLVLAYWDRLFPLSAAEQTQDGRFGITLVTSLKLTLLLAGIVGLGSFMWVAILADGISIGRVLLGVLAAVINAFLYVGVSIATLYAKYRMAFLRERQDTFSGLLINLTILPLVTCFIVALLIGVHPVMLGPVAVIGLIAGATVRGWDCQWGRPTKDEDLTSKTNAETDPTRFPHGSEPQDESNAKGAGERLRASSIGIVVMYLLLGTVFGHVAYYKQATRHLNHHFDSLVTAPQQFVVVSYFNYEHLPFLVYGALSGLVTGFILVFSLDIFRSFNIE